MVQTRILFVCTGNIFRSPSAEYCLKQYLQQNKIEGIDVSSAGTIASPEAFEESVLATLGSYGINPSGHVQRRITQELADTADLVVAMADYHQKFIRERFGKNVPLFNEICLGEKTSVWDVNDVIPDFATNRAAFETHVAKTITHIHDSTPFFVRNLGTFLNPKKQI